MRYRIDAVIEHGEHVKEFRLVPADGSAAPDWLPGAHIALVIEAAGGRERMVLLDDLAPLQHGRIVRYATETEGRPALEALIGPWIDGSELHACGPAPLLQAISAVAASQGWPTANVHFESFGARSAAGDRLLRVHLRQSDITVDVQPRTPILDALIAADAFVSYECRRGECGNCFAPVVYGRPLHRPDNILESCCVMKNSACRN